MIKLWIFCGVVALAGCQGEKSQPAAPRNVEVVVAPSPPAKQPTEVAPPALVPPATKQARSKAPQQPVEPGGTAPQPVQAAPVAPPPAPPLAAVPAVAITTAAVAPMAAAAETDEAAMALARKSNCFACHALDKKVVGPAFKAVAAKYRGDEGAQALLENKIIKGGGGAWGAVPMPAQPRLRAEQSAQLARYILNLE